MSFRPINTNTAHQYAINTSIITCKHSIQVNTLAFISSDFNLIIK
nr:MAG TPA: hypothetical protein [Caudoviricetes sp.]